MSAKQRPALASLLDTIRLKTSSMRSLAESKNRATKAKASSANGMLNTLTRMPVRSLKATPSGKHGGELGADTPDELAEIIEGTINGATDSKTREGGRTAFCDAESNTLVIVDPSSPDGGTVFKPGAGQGYYDNLR